MSSWPCRCSTAACRSRRRRRGAPQALPRPVPAAGTPVASANTTPLTMTGVAGEERSCETQPGSSDGAPPASVSFSATTAPAETAPVGGSTSRRPAPAGRERESMTCRRSTPARSPGPLRSPMLPAPRNGFDASERRGVIGAAKRRGVQQQDASVLRRGGDDVPVVVPEDRRAGDELRRRLGEPVLQLQRLRVERDNRVGLAVAGRLPGTDRRDQRAVRRERDRADDSCRRSSSTTRPASRRCPDRWPTRHPVRRRTSPRSRRTASCPPPPARTTSRSRAGTARGAGCPCRTARPSTCSMPSLDTT